MLFLLQILFFNHLLGGTLKERKVTNVVLMGCGEPLDNYDNVAKFLKLVSSPEGLNISQRNISLSTCGIVPNIYKLADDGFSVTLTISLHAPNDELRKTIMPIANAYSITEKGIANSPMVSHYSLDKDNSQEGKIIYNVTYNYNNSNLNPANMTQVTQYRNAYKNNTNQATISLPLDINMLGFFKGIDQTSQG